VIVMLLLGAGTGAGLLLVTRGLRPRPLPLADVLRALDAPASPGAATVSGRRIDLQRWLAEPIERHAPRLVGAGLRRDLAVLDRSVERHVAEKLTTAVALFAIPLVLQLALVAIGSPLPPLGALGLAALGLVGGFFVPDLTIRSQATHRRDAFRHALSSYLDLVNVLLAGGAGIETALEAAAEAGDGWAFAEIRRALLRARAARRSPWACFSELGERLGVDELLDLSASVQLAGEQGARVRASLAAKAASLRAHQVARVEADAQSASERMGLPTVLMFVAFLLLLGYPAVQQIAGS
jgi:Flp pilus assembly protein TadB